MMQNGKAFVEHQRDATGDRFFAQFHIFAGNPIGIEAAEFVKKPTTHNNIGAIEGAWHVFGRKADPLPP